MSPRDETPTAPEARPIAFAVHARRNIVVQALGLTMVVLACLNAVPWPIVAGWTAVAVLVLAAENHVLRIAAKEGRLSGPVGPWALTLRIAATSLYALAALALMARGGPDEHLFAFALITASMLHVLMRYYRWPWILAAVVSPYLGVLGLVAVTQFRLANGHPLASLIATFTLGTFGLQFWWPARSSPPPGAS